MPTHALKCFCTRRWLLLAVWAGACVGTPTPEPPDNLPSPDAGRIFGTSVIDVLANPEIASTAVPLAGGAGAVAPGADLWIVNLDDPSAAPITLRPRADGGFSTKLTANMGDRLRLISRSARRHSLPLDAVFANGADSSDVNPMVSIVALPPQELSCVELAPRDEITRVVATGKTQEQSFVLTNRCNGTVQITNASLRFGDTGFSLATPPQSVPQNRSASLTITFEGHDDERERADILLLDVSLSGQNAQAGGRYALGVWSVSSSGSGND
ncbi:MAG: hypothetical protein RLZZ450_3231 [Pseudomonadota bacterium]|jgi:hypothetical protein